MSPSLVPLGEPEEILLVEYSCKGDNCIISSVFESEGYSSDYIDTLSLNPAMSVELSNGDSYSVDYPNILYIEGHNSDGTMIADHRKLNGLTDSLIVKNPMENVEIKIKNAAGMILDTYDYIYGADSSPSYVGGFGSKFVKVREVI